MGLNGRTPAEAANLPLQLGDNKWLSLIRMSANGFNHVPKNSNQNSIESSFIDKLEEINEDAHFEVGK